MSTIRERTRRLPGWRTLAAWGVSINATMAGGCGPSLPPDLREPAAPATVGQPDDELTSRQHRQIEVFGRTVLNPSHDIQAETRRHAAEELIAMNVPAAIDILDQSLRSGQPQVILPVIDAMASSPQPVQGLLEAAISTMQESSGEALEKLSMVLPRYGPPALDMVSRRALDREVPPVQRIGFIHALGAFRTRDSASRIMALLDGQHPAPREIITAACASLGRLTGLPYDSDVQQWRRWWAEHGDEPVEDWLGNMVQQLSSRITEIEQQIQLHKQANDDIAGRLADTLHELFMVLSPNEQLDRLPELLSDELVPVRQFAMGRVERLLRDSERVPEPVPATLAQRLRDTAEVSPLRLSAAGLLHDLNYQGTAELVAAALNNESDHQIATGYLEILAKRPTQAGLDATLRWLNDPAAGKAAAQALWAIISNDLLEDVRLPAARRAARAALEQQGTPLHARLLAGIGEDQDLARVEGLLDAPDPAARRAVAEGLCWAGRKEPLLRRVGDDEVYPFVVRVLIQGPADLATLRQVAQLAPPEAHHQEWAHAIRALAERLAPADLLAADDMLASLEHVDLQLRAAVLAKVADIPPKTTIPQQRSSLLARLAELRLALGQYELAFDVIQALDGAPMTPALARLRFRAAALAGHYEEAADFNEDVLAWVELLVEAAEPNPLAAVALRKEIQRRFGDQLVGEAQARFENAMERLPPDTVTDGTSRPEPDE